MSADLEPRNPIKREGDMEENGRVQWTPEWAVVVRGQRIGITMDDGCFVFLSVFDNAWQPLNWIPPQAVLRAAEIHALGGFPIKNGEDLLIADGPAVD